MTLKVYFVEIQMFLGEDHKATFKITWYRGVIFNKDAIQPSRNGETVSILLLDQHI